VKGRLSPDTNTEYLIYQTLVALWPPPRPGRRVDDLPDRQWREAARERMVRYALKAAREAKTSTSWVEPVSEYENALNTFIAAILEPSDDAPFLTDVARLVSRLAPIGAANSLSRIALHLTSPGTPDVYQGDELWNFTLVDPDNRAQVDYDLRARLLCEVAGATDLPDRVDNRLKLLVTSRLLRARRERPELFTRGDYTPLAATGPRASHVVAFARSAGEHRLITIATRLPCDRVGRDPNTWWMGTSIDVPEHWRDSGWRSLISGETLGPAISLNVGELLRTIPVAVLVG
jgi:(1->4)-alpha-D-glucan 1-alpha-D-glucosylmutase